MKNIQKQESWVSKKLKDPKFKEQVEEEYAKISIGEELLQLRLQADLTQSELAKKVGTTGSAISRYENATYDRYELRTIKQIVKACGGKLKLIFEGPLERHPA